MKFEITEQRIGALAFNKEEIAKELDEQLKKYDNLIIADEKEIGDFKKIRANLNGVIKTFDEERKRIKKEYCVPLLAFEADIKELTGKIEKVNAKIDTQIKAYEDKARIEKLEKIKELINNKGLSEIDSALFFNEKWLNLSYSLKSIEEDLEAIKSKIREDLDAITALYKGNEELEVKYEYTKTLNLSKVIQEHNEKKERIQEIKSKSKEDKQEEKYCLNFRVIATSEQIKALNDFLKENEIEFTRL